MAFRVPHRILVVEDSTELRQLLVRLFTDAGFEVSEACSVAGALAALTNVSPDIVITDGLLPDATFEFIPTMKLRHPMMPVIVLSGDPEAARLLLPGADEVLGKPVSFPEIIQTIFRFIDAVEADRFNGGLAR